MRRFGFCRGEDLYLLVHTLRTFHVQRALTLPTVMRCLTTCPYWSPVTVHLRESPN